ncbi:MAG: outer membrane protein assembly factor BamD [Deltaproteobacteria bacterium]
MKIKIIIPVMIILFCIVGCQLSFFKKDGMVKGTPEGLYARGALEYQEGNYKKAREYFTRLREEHPLNSLAVLADMGIADSYFTDKSYIEAEGAYSDFVNLHPTNENVPYAIYQAGMCHYKQIEAIDRDQTETVKARKEFEKLGARYPESKFTTMAERFIVECKQKQAEHEFYVGKFYFTQKKYKAALTRLEKIAKEYANIGLDYKVEYLISETKIKIAEEEKLQKEQEAKDKAKEAKKKAKEEEKKAKEEQKAAQKKQ